MNETIKSYKGFNRDMTCRDFKYEVGKDYETGEAEVCSCGFHACEYPLDVFSYYPPAQSVYHEVEQSGEISKDSDDSKAASTKIHIGARLDIRGLVSAAIEFTRSRTTTEHTDPEMATAGDRGAATAGNCGAATAGEYGAATAGDCGAATARNRGAATAGNCGAATAGEYGAATAGEYGAATAGEYGAATAGNCGAATSRGSSAAGENGLAVARRNNVRVKGGLGAILIIAEENRHDYEISQWKAAIVDGKKVKADTWYCLKGGELAEYEDV